MKKIFEISWDDRRNALGEQAIKAKDIKEALDKIFFYPKEIKVTEITQQDHGHYYPDCSGVEERAKRREPQPTEYCECGYYNSDCVFMGIPPEKCHICHKTIKPQPTEYCNARCNVMAENIKGYCNWCGKPIKWINQEGK